MKPGIYHNLAERTYRADPAISQSSLKPILRSPAHFKAGVEEDDKEETGAMLLGSIAGQLVLEPHLPPWWEIQPEKLALSTTEGKEWAKSICKWDEEKDGKFPRSPNDAFDLNGISVISFKGFENASRMAAALAESKKPEVRDILDGSKREVSVFANVETPSGVVLCKSRPDIVPPESNILADLKTCQIASEDGFLKSVKRFRYDIQAASYLHHYNSVSPADDRRELFYFLVIESTAPFAIKVHQLDEDYMRKGRGDYERAINTYAYCQQIGEWPDYAPGVNTIKMPKYFNTEIL